MASKKSVIVGQSGGPTSVINSSIAGIFSEAVARGYKCYGMVHGIKGLLEGSYIDMEEYIKSEVDVELLKRTPSAWLGSCRYKLPEIEGNEEIYEKIMDTINALNVEIFIYTGGNDSMDTINKLSIYGKKTGSSVKFVGCPKTIDNDLAHTDHSPGYGSAAKYIAASVKEMLRDVKSIEPPKGNVTVVEIMGRDAGWLTAAAALANSDDAGKVDGIYLPEVDFDVDAFMTKVANLLKEKKTVIMCVSEGVHTSEGKYVCELGAANGFVDAFGHTQLTGTAQYLCNRIAAELGPKTRAVEFSILQRAASHFASLTDVNEAFQAGCAAVKAGDEGRSGVMVTLERVSDKPYLCDMKVYDVEKIANDARLVPLEWITGDKDDISDEFIKYAAPLIVGESAPIMVGGLPKYLPGPVK